MKSLHVIIFLIIAILLSSCGTPTLTPTLEFSSEEITTDSATTALPEDNILSTPVAVSPTPSPTSTQNPFASLYGCKMQLNINSGPLESKKTQFTVLGEDYFSDKGDKFKTGKGTGIYYQDQHYFIIHSSYVNGNILRPMEGELFRKYLEYWGDIRERLYPGTDRQFDWIRGHLVM